MKNEKLLIVGLVALAVFAGVVAGLKLRKDEARVKNTEAVSILTDKERYVEGETANIEVIVYSSERREVVLKVYGIKSRYNRYHVLLQKEAVLLPGENVVNFSATMPYCNSCAGISPGEYELNAEVWQNDTLIAWTSEPIYLGR